MSSRVLIGFDEEQSPTPGEVPEFGAIFMSNSATKKECLRRKLLGLPSVQGNFVKQVKAGMILFLFEFERRELHGVFQACSNGSMNIVPHAFSSSGKQFTAQVKFTTIWNCSPLSESEFCDAIRENYFSPKKFKFGLSERQVKKLLLLFSSRKLTNKPLERQFCRNSVTRPIGYSGNKARGTFGFGSYEMIAGENDGQNADGSFGFVNCDVYREESISNYGRLIDEYDDDDDKFARALVGNGHNVDRDLRQVMLNPQLGDPLDRVRRNDGDQFVTSDMVGDECHVPMVRTNHPKHVFATSRRTCDNSNPTGYGPGVVCDGGDCFRPLISTDNLGLFHSSPPLYSSNSILEPSSLINDPVQQSSIVPRLMKPWNCNFSSSTSYEDAKPMPNCYSTTYGDAVVSSAPPYVSDLPGLNYRSSSSLGLSDSVPEDSPSHNSIVPHFIDQSFTSYLEPKGISRCPNIIHGLPGDSSFSSPNHYGHKKRMIFPGTAYPGLVQRKSSENEGFPEPSFMKTMPPYENCEEFGPNLSMLKEHKNRNIDYLENTSKNLSAYQNSERLYSDHDKKRESVFSRLALPEDNVSFVEDVESHVDSSLEEIMTMLHQNHHHWVKEKSPKPHMHGTDDVAKFRNKKTANSNSKLVKGCFTTTPKEMTSIVISPVELKGVQTAEEIPFVDFKRRSKVRKTQDDASAKDLNEIGEVDGISGGQHKRRKLNRPQFNKDESSAGVMVKCLDKEKKVSQNVKLPYLHIGCEDKNIDAEASRNHDRDLKVKSYVASSSTTDDKRKEPTQSVSLQDVPLTGSCGAESCDAEEGWRIKNSEVGGLSQHHPDTGDIIIQESFPELHRESVESGIVFSGSDQNEHNGKFIAFDSTRGSSLNHGSGSEKVCDELGHGAGNKELLLLELGIGSHKMCKSSSENSNCCNMQESSEKPCQNDRNAAALAATAGRDNNMSCNQHTGTLSGSCKGTEEWSDIFSSHQRLASSQELSGIDLNDEK